MALIADESGQRTEAPTPLRLEEARRQGRVARSGDLVSAALLLGGLAVLAVAGGGLMESLKAFTASSLSAASINADPLAPLGKLGGLVGPLAPVLIIPMIVAIAANFMQVGPLVSAAVVRPDLARVSPAAGLRRLMSLRPVVRLAMAMAKIALVAGICVATIRPALGAIVSTALAGPSGLMTTFGSLAVPLGLRIAAALGVLAVADWLYQRWQHRQDLRITRRQWLDDLRRMEGDPQISSRLRQRARQLASQRLAVDMPNASLVLVGAGGLAVALQYAPAMEAPRVIGRGQEYLAARIRHLARMHHVRIVEDAELTGRIFSQCRVGDEIPERLYESIAELLAGRQSEAEN